MGKLTQAAARLRKLAEIYRGFVVAEAELGKVGGLARAAGALAREAQAARDSTERARAEERSAAQRLDQVRAEYHRALAIVERDPRKLVRDARR